MFHGPPPGTNLLSRKPETRRRMSVRATINLPGLRAGAVVQVDPSVPYIAGLLASNYLVPAG